METPSSLEQGLRPSLLSSRSQEGTLMDNQGSWLTVLPWKPQVRFTHHMHQEGHHARAREEGEEHGAPVSGKLAVSRCNKVQHKVVRECDKR